jgi:hypothetical protein
MWGWNWPEHRLREPRPVQAIVDTPHSAQLYLGRYGVAIATVKKREKIAAFFARDEWLRGKLWSALPRMVPRHRSSLQTRPAMMLGDYLPQDLSPEPKQYRCLC